jgi:hypothetical protein
MLRDIDTVLYKLLVVLLLGISNVCLLDAVSLGRMRTNDLLSITTTVIALSKALFKA